MPSIKPKFTGICSFVVSCTTTFVCVGCLLFDFFSGVRFKRASLELSDAFSLAVFLFFLLP
jgi:hypothetical protein